MEHKEWIKQVAYYLGVSEFDVQSIYGISNLYDTDPKTAAEIISSTEEELDKINTEIASICEDFTELSQMIEDVDMGDCDVSNSSDLRLFRAKALELYELYDDDKYLNIKNAIDVLVNRMSGN